MLNMSDSLMIGVAVAGVLLLLAIAFLVRRADRNAARRRARWHHEYFHRGGLIRSLIRNWRPQGRLTDQRDLDR